MATLVKPMDLATLLDVPQDNPKLVLALQRASDRFIGDVGWPVAEATATVTLYGDGGIRMFVPAMNVTVATVTDVDGVVIAVLDSRLGMLTLAGGWVDGAAYTVVYTCGWNEVSIPGDIQDAVLEQAAHVASTLGVFSQENRGSLSGSYSPGALGGVTQRWSDTVDRYTIGGRS